MKLINPNLADEEILETLPGVGKVIAKRIIAARPIETLLDLQAVKGIGVEKAEQLAPFLNLRIVKASTPSFLTAPPILRPQADLIMVDLNKRLVILLILFFMSGWLIGRLKRGS